MVSLYMVPLVKRKLQRGSKKRKGREGVGERDVHPLSKVTRGGIVVNCRTIAPCLRRSTVICIALQLRGAGSR